MALFLRELTAKPLDKNRLRNGIDIKEHDQSDQTKNDVDLGDLEDGLRTSAHFRETPSDNCKSEEKSDKDRVTPDPPIALLNFLEFARQGLVSCLYRRRDGVCAGVTHGWGRGTKLPRFS